MRKIPGLPLLPPRRRDSHKGDYGRILVLAGSRGMTGAANLAGMGALRSGAGLVTVGVPDAIYLIVAKRDSELMFRPLPFNGPWHAFPQRIFRDSEIHDRTGCSRDRAGTFAK